MTVWSYKNRCKRIANRFYGDKSDHSVRQRRLPGVAVFADGARGVLGLGVGRRHPRHGGRGACFSNAGAYRGNIGPLVTQVRVFADGRDQTVGPEWMEFSYRDSRLRRLAEQGGPIGRTVILSCRLRLSERGDPDAILARAKEYQAQRRAKQPYAPSAGSFFKNVVDKSLAETVSGLSPGMRAAGVVPAGFLSEACGLKGLREGGAGVSQEHANFLVNAGGATATDVRRLAARVKAAVWERFGVGLEEEVLYVGDWSGWDAEGNAP